MAYIQFALSFLIAGDNAILTRVLELKGASQLLGGFFGGFFFFKAESFIGDNKYELIQNVNELNSTNKAQNTYF